MSTELCDARCLVWSPRASSTGKAGVASCALAGGHLDQAAAHFVADHRSRDVDEEGSRFPTAVCWQENDRRTFRGELALCPDPRCVLPAGHGGRHAY
jgi:hypothetical protein